MFYDALVAALSDFHFLRPWWLLALLPALFVGWFIARQAKYEGEWSTIIAPELLPYMLEGTASKKRNHSLAWLLGWVLGITALAGPSWQKIPQPVLKQDNALVILFDLSPSMMAEDITPNRLTRARLKLIDILNKRQEGTTALVTYSADAFTVSPLTDDAKTIAASVPALHPGIVPALGSNTEAAVAQAVHLLRNAGKASGDILIITDGISTQARVAIDTQLRDRLQIRVSVLGVGTAAGAPIPLGNGQFAKDHRDAIVLPKLNSSSLKNLTKRLGGRYSELTASDQDIDYLLAGVNASLLDQTASLVERTFDSWDDQGFWLAIACLPLLLLGFRQGVVALVILVPLLSTPQQAVAFEWRDLWQRSDQQANQAFQEQDYQAAKELFDSPEWQAAAAYRNGDYEQATTLYNDGSATADYNRGNALIKDGKLTDAIEAYTQALEKQPNFDDAAFNKALAEKLLEQQQSQSSDQNQQQQSDDQQQQGSQSDQNQQDSSQSNSDTEQQQNEQAQGQQDSESANQQQGTSSQDSSDQQHADNSQPENSDATNNDQQQATQEQIEQHQQVRQTADQEQAGANQQAMAEAAKRDDLTDEQQQAMEQWLRRIPDDPGGLLREKFRAESRKRAIQRRQGLLPPKPPSEQRW